MEDKTVQGMQEEELRKRSIAYFKEQVGKVLRLPSTKINTSEPLARYGLDSLLVIQLTRTLRTDMGGISSALFFQYPTIDALVEHLMQNQKEILELLVDIRAKQGDILTLGSSQFAQPNVQGSLQRTTRTFRRFLTKDKTVETTGNHKGCSIHKKEMALPVEKDAPKSTLHRTDTYSVILAPHPSPLMGGGTNTIILGDQSTGAVVIDPATNDPEYLSDIIQEGKRYGGIRRILITHGHFDHIGGAEALQAQLSVPILAFSTKHVPFADEEIADNTLFPIGDDMLRALYTPGHCSDHLCFWLEKQRILFAGDLVTSNGPSFILSPPEGDLQDYMHSLERVRNLESIKIIPAHGETILRPQELLAACLTLCQKRKQQILQVVRDAPQGIDIKTIVQAVYKNVDTHFYDFMDSTVLSHLSLLEREGKVKHKEHKQVEQKDYWVFKGDDR